MDIEFIRRVLGVFNGFDGPNGESLWWRTDGEYAPVTFFANCNDLFVWGSADSEPITPETIDVLEQSLRDLQAVAEAKANPRDELNAIVYTPDLYVARVRGMRPQGACYKYFPKGTWPLFDACGPEREVDFHNPEPHP